MANTIPCPNPTCPHDFRQAELQTASAVQCPKCGFRMHGRGPAQATPAASKPIVPAKPAASPAKPIAASKPASATLAVKAAPTTFPAKPVAPTPAAAKPVVAQPITTPAA